MFDTLQKVKTKNLGSHQKDRKDRFQNNKRQETFFAICDAGYSGEKKIFFCVPFSKNIFGQKCTTSPASAEPC